MTPAEREEAARREWGKAYDAANKLDKARYEERRAALEAIERELSTKYSAQQTEARKLVSERQAAWNAAKIEAAKVGNGLPVPLGSKVVEWALPRWSHIGKEWRPTGKVGVLVVSEENHNSFVTVGSVAIQRLKKDGTPSKLFERGLSSDFQAEGRSRLAYGWYPEGVNPNAGATGGQEG